MFDEYYFQNKVKAVSVMKKKKKKGLMGNEEKEMAEQIKKQLFSLSYERKPPCPARVELNRKGSLDDQFQRDMEETKAISLLKQTWHWQMKIVEIAIQVNSKENPIWLTPFFTGCC